MQLNCIYKHDKNSLNEILKSVSDELESLDLPTERVDYELEEVTKLIATVDDSSDGAI